PGPVESASKVVDQPEKPIFPEAVAKVDEPKIMVKRDVPPVSAIENIVYLDNDLWQTQPRTLIRVELRGSTTLEGGNIQKYLIITPGIVEAEQVNKDRINIIAKNRGSTILHVWDDRGRWTFKVEVILPVLKTRLAVIEDQVENYAKPFKLSQSADWSSFYRGQSLPESKRENLSFLQRYFLEGETPYGDFDSHVTFNKFDASTEVTGYGVGLTNGKIGNFKDFRIRGYDIQKIFSPLTLPGQYVRGVLLEAKAFDKNIEYAYIHGRDRQIFGFLSPGVRDKRESFVEGARVTLFPEKENQYSVNYARGYGSAREPFLKDQVFSFEAQHRLNAVLFSGEYAYDESASAVTARSHYMGEEHSLTVTFRDIEEDFASVW
ncbi:MAG: pilus assembly protein N-terminal domain-containing protein, partial [Candidatus Margulisiibacteriota bacterium]